MQAMVGRRAMEKQAASTNNTLSRFETEVLVTKENQKGLEQLNAAWVDRAMMRTWHQRVILGMDSSESPVYGGVGRGSLQRAFPVSVLPSTLPVQLLRGLRGSPASGGERPQRRPLTGSPCAGGGTLSAQGGASALLG